MSKGPHIVNRRESVMKKFLDRHLHTFNCKLSKKQKTNREYGKK